MKPEQIHALDEEQLRNLHLNCLLSLDHPKRSADAHRLTAVIHDEFGRRSVVASGSGFVPMLRCIGYNVRWKDLEAKQRRFLLDWAYRAELPRINGDAYMDSWGTPGSRQRLRCLYGTIARYLRRYGHDNVLQEVAVARWKADLAYIKEKADEEKRANPAWSDEPVGGQVPEGPHSRPAC